MTTIFSRRRFLAQSTATGAVLAFAYPRPAPAAGTALPLVATRRNIEVKGRAAEVFALEGPDGRPGLTLEPGARFRVRLENRTGEPTLVHWHGQIPPNAQDGVPDTPAPALAPGEARDYDFAALPGTHWMHSHFPAQEMAHLAAPLIVHSVADLRADRQDVVMFLQDFTFLPLAEHLARLNAPAAGGHGGHGMAGGGMGMMPGGMGHAMMGQGMQGMMMADVNDIDFDAYLANGRDLSDPDVVTVDRGGRVRLRIINAGSATVFWIDTLDLDAALVAVDGHDVAPLAGRLFPVAMGQRLDIELAIPAGGGAFPVLARREGAPERTGLVLATPGARVARLSGQGAAAPVMGTQTEALLRTREPLSVRAAEWRHDIMLQGGMQPYLWTLDGHAWPAHRAIRARSGARVELTLHNPSMMSHPMHLHGHVFQVIGIGGHRFSGARRDTVLVPPMQMLSIAFDAGEAADWMLHCHHIPHLASGMMTRVTVTA